MTSPAGVDRDLSSLIAVWVSAISRLVVTFSVEVIYLLLLNTLQNNIRNISSSSCGAVSWSVSTGVPVKIKMEK